MSRAGLLSSRGPGTVALASMQAGRGFFYEKALKRRLIPRKVFGFTLLLDLEDKGISRTLLLFGKREMEHMWILERVLKPGMSVLDVGSNIGYYPLIELQLIGPTGAFHAIEPDPRNVELLKKNLEFNGYGHIKVTQAAVSDGSGEIDLLLSGQRNLNTIIENNAPHLSGNKITVPLMTVQQVRGDMRPDLIRMDVEGAEVGVINGALEEIRSGAIAPMILFETHLGRYSEDNDIRGPLEALFDLGYTVPYAGSSWEQGTEIVAGFGYSPVASMRTDDVVRAIFMNVEPEDVVRIVSKTGGLRSILLAPSK